MKKILPISIIVFFFLGFNLLDFEKSLLAPATFSHWLGTWGILKMSFYWLVYTATIVSLVAGLFSSLRPVRWITLGLILLFGSVEFTYQSINGYGSSFFDILVALQQNSYAGEALGQFYPQIGQGIVIALLLSGFLAGLTRLIQLRFHWGWLLLAPLAFGLVYTVLWRTHAGTAQFPPVYKIPALFTYAVQSPLLEERKPVALPAPREERARHIIFIIDESIRGDFLQINGFPAPTTPFLASIRQRMINLGVASSAANCSQTSNIILQSGLQADQLPDRQQFCLKAPNIFQYARAAGYTTYFLEGQYAPGQLPPLMRSSDLDHIDEIFQIDKADSLRSGYYTDYTLAAKIREILATDSAAFILVNKKGAHFHYENHYPAEKRYFTPTLASLQERVDKRQVDDFLSEVDRTRMINSYGNILRWAVDGFFQALLAGLNLEDCVLLYTSDHGQSFQEGSTALTHCVTVDPPSSNAAVPLFLLGGFSERYFANPRPAGQYRASHFQIFPTLLTFMGFDAAAVRKTYGHPLWDVPQEPRYFVSGDLFGRGQNSRLNLFQLQPFDPLLNTPKAVAHQEETD